MSARNTLEGKAYRRTRRETRDLLNKDSHYAQPTAKFGTCEVTGRYLPVDFEHNICEPAWVQIARFVGEKVPQFRNNRAGRRQVVVQKDKQTGQGYDWNREWNW